MFRPSFPPRRPPFSPVPSQRSAAFDFYRQETKTNNRDASKKSNDARRLRVPVVGALAFGFFVAPCLVGSTASQAQTSLVSPTPSTLPSPTRPQPVAQPVYDRSFNRETQISQDELKAQEIEASRFSSGIYGDPAPDNPSPFLTPRELEAPPDSPDRTPLPPFFPASAGDSEPSVARARLEELAWAVGAWELETNGFIFQTKIEWAPGGSYLLCRDFVRPVASSAPNKGETQEPASTFAALRVIGWNPVAGLYQSTIFCRDGSYGTGLWQREGAAWRVATKILLVDGRAATSVEYFSPRPKSGFAWESTSRTVENAPLPNVGPAQARAIDPRIIERLERSKLNDALNADLPQTDVEFE